MRKLRCRRRALTSKKKHRTSSPSPRLIISPTQQQRDKADEKRKFRRLERSESSPRGTGARHHCFNLENGCAGVAARRRTCEEFSAEIRETPWHWRMTCSCVFPPRAGLCCVYEGFGSSSHLLLHPEIEAAFFLRARRCSPRKEETAVRDGGLIGGYFAGGRINGRFVARGYEENSWIVVVAVFFLFLMDTNAYWGGRNAACFCYWFLLGC